jgi:hypothetical protein
MTRPRTGPTRYGARTRADRFTFQQVAAVPSPPSDRMGQAQHPTPIPDEEEQR